MSKLDLDEFYHESPEEQISPGDHDAIVLGRTQYLVTLAQCRELMHIFLTQISKSPNFNGDIHGDFEWHADEDDAWVDCFGVVT